MLQDPAPQDILSPRRPSPWPMVGTMILGTGLISLLINAFSG
ncbi:hypothetical protein [Roseibium aestuarii]|uniref:Uncharacterized protein n=1 Tax=Roseibium aestuarii TaxID=2600299 RepID=A0ABW4JWQ9_9HYPH|nr:hypothetical protein [Roseibium aestuarii]